MAPSDHTYEKFLEGPLAGAQILKDSSSVEAERFLFHAVDVLKVSAQLGLVLFGFLVADSLWFVVYVEEEGEFPSTGQSVWMDQQCLCQTVELWNNGVNINICVHMFNE